MSDFFYTLDLFGTFIFALSGGFRAVKYELDILGVLILAISTGVGGGLIRDCLLGATPPASFKNEYYLIACILGGLMVFLWPQHLAYQWRKIIVSDALGLGLFTAIGAIKALQFGLGPVGVTMMAVLTATGGGVVRDVLVREIPSIIHSDFYATAALIGAVGLYCSYLLGASELTQTLVALTITTGLRLYAIKHKLSLPKATKLSASPSELNRKKL